MLGWFMRKSTCVFAMLKDPDRSKNLMFILDVLGPLKKSRFLMLLQTTLSQVPLRMTRMLRVPVNLTTRVQILGAFIEFMGPVGSDMTTHPVWLVILLGTLVMPGRKPPLVPRGQKVSLVLVTRVEVWNSGQ